MAKISPISFSSCFSFGNGAISPAHMAGALASRGFTTLPLTDELSYAGLPEAITAARNANLILLAGLRHTLAPDNYFLFFPDDQLAYCSLNQSASRFIADEGKSAGSATTLTSWLRLNGSGRIVFFGPATLSHAAMLYDTGWRCFINIPVNGSMQTLQQACDIASRFSMQTIIAPDLVCAEGTDVDAVRLIRAFKSGALLADIKTFKPLLPESMRKFDDLADRFPDAAANNREFVRQSSWVPPTGALQMPQFQESPNQSLAMLTQLATKGLQKKYPTITQKITARFELEMKTISQLGFADYFLVVSEITEKARQLGHRVLGRGSAANSLISFVLDFTQVDPIKHNLYFERFLNVSRQSPPDIDLDFSWRIRDQIYQFLLERWGSERVALISTHISLRGRGALRETGKTLGYNNEDISYATSMIGYSSLAQFLENPEKFSRFKILPERLALLKPLIAMAAKIEGVPTHFSIHAGGVVIAPGSIYRFTPTFHASKVLPVTQLEMHGIENFGLVKFDLLSQRSLGVYSDLMQAANQSLPDSPSEKPAPSSRTNLVSDKQILQTNKETVITPPPADPQIIEKDPDVANALANGRTIGVFYIESPGMRGLLQKLGCNTYTGLIAASSIIRPGVAESGMMQEYIRRHQQPDNWKPVHPLLGSLLAETYGVMVYQEDVMKIAHHIAGFTLAEADVLRRAMSGKERSSNQMQNAHERFISGAAAHDIKPDVANEIWRQISSFCGYAFCKAHSASYAVLSLELLWFKQHFPGPFMAAVINNRGGFYGPQAYISEARRLGLAILPPDVTRSDAEFTCQGSIMQTGLSFIAGIQSETVSKILTERQRKPFASLEDFLSRIKPATDEFDNLINSGALSLFGSAAACRWLEKLMPRNSLFCEPPPCLPPGAQSPVNHQEVIKSEIKSLGFCVSGHPLEIYQQPSGACTAEKLPNLINRRVKIFGLLIAAKSITTSSGASMKFLTLEDKTGLIEVVFFPDAWKKIQMMLDYTMALEITGTVKSDHGSLTIHGETLRKH